MCMQPAVLVPAMPQVLEGVGSVESASSCPKHERQSGFSQDYHELASEAHDGRCRARLADGDCSPAGVHKNETVAIATETTVE